MEFFIVGEMVKLSSYYTGRWVSHYSVDLGNSDIHVVFFIRSDHIVDWRSGYSISLFRKWKCANVRSSRIGTCSIEFV